MNFLFVLRKYYKKFSLKRSRTYQICKKELTGKKILEIGGPSKIFSSRGLLPVYPLIRYLDNCNFSNETVWDNNSLNKESISLYPPNILIGDKFIAEMTDLKFIPSKSYDGILSSHVIEHSANPILALSEWKRVLKDNGILVVLIPHKDGTFDHLRPLTSLNHLIEDYENGTSENDLMHLPEILELHDLEKDPEAGSINAFKNRSIKNLENRCLHHHVFNTEIAVNMINYVDLQILAVETKKPAHIIIIAQKLPGNYSPDNCVYINDKAEYRVQSVFNSDMKFSKV